MKTKSICVELKKIYRKKSFLIFTVLLMITTALLTIYVKNTSLSEPLMLEKISEKEFNEKGYKDYENYLLQYENYEEEFNNQNEIKNYFVYNDIEDNTNEKLKFETSYIVLIFLSLYIIVLSSKSLASEYELGTIKRMLLTNKKSDIILSKIISLVIVSLFLSLIIYLTNLITIQIIDNINIFELTNIVYKNNKFIEQSFLLEHTCEYFLYFIPNIFIICLTLMIGLIFKSSSVSSVISMFLTISSSFLTDLLMGLKLRFISHTFLPYMDLSIFKDKFSILVYNMENSINLNINNGIFIIILTSIFCIIISFIIIHRREYK